MVPVLIAVDWGTTSFRAYLLGEDGTILGRRQSPQGILSVAPPASGGRLSAGETPDAMYKAVLAEAVAPWLGGHPGLAILMSGMIGSRQGWVEAPYVHCPAGVTDIAEQLVRVPAGDLGAVWLAPGFDTRDAGGTPDVMRGEEVQVFGAMLAGAPGDSPAGSRPPGASSIVLPGSHSKWVTVEGGRIAAFRTFMTGEVYGALKDHTILGRLMIGDTPHPQGFAAGVRAAASGEGPGWLLGALFSVRSLGLFDMLPAQALADYLSGLLIGAEIVQAAGRGAQFQVLAGEPLLSRYVGAARLLGCDAQPVPAESIALGYLAIARAAGVLEARP